MPDIVEALSIGMDSAENPYLVVKCDHPCKDARTPRGSRDHALPICPVSGDPDIGITSTPGGPPECPQRVAKCHGNRLRLRRPWAGGHHLFPVVAVPWPPDIGELGGVLAA